MSPTGDMIEALWENNKKKAARIIEVQKNVSERLSKMGFEMPQDMVEKIAIFERIARGERPDFHEFLAAFGEFSLWLAQVEALIMKLSDVSKEPPTNDNNKRVH